MCIRDRYQRRVRGPLLMAMWQYTGDRGQWVWYDAESSAALEAAWASKADGLDLKLGGGSYSVHFGSMQQRNNNTGYKRKVQRLGPSPGCPGLMAPDSSTPAVLWEWQEGPKWHLYDSKTAGMLEEAVAAGQPALSYKVHDKRYDIDLNNSRQTNAQTGFTRAVRRRCMGPEPVSAPMAAPAEGEAEEEAEGGEHWGDAEPDAGAALCVVHDAACRRGLHCVPGEPFGQQQRRMCAAEQVCA
eukprot:TRINITY_DN3453_c0_g1_i3.p1 TRINITY_DN3453_c0_g1~~TRINITY_DN3453_c0_g1_i3.p1  ORF type:complete len:242 (+),score=64.32 TRINITY_DN3453_c0_g1_i3:143-868(+)